MFNKLVAVGFNENTLEASKWERIIKSALDTITIEPDGSNIAGELGDADALLLRLGGAASKELIDSAPNLKYIGMYGTGYGKVDTDYAASKQIAVTNVPDYSTESVAEFVVGVLLDHFRELERARRQATDGNYSEGGFTGTELRSLSFGIVGAGNIGARVARLLSSGFNANVCFWSRNRKPELESESIPYVKLSELASSCDVVSLHVSATSDTSGMFNRELLVALKPGAVLVNTAPMELIDMSALQQRLKRGDTTFIWDHSDEVDPVQVKELQQFPNCITYPPIAYTSEQASIAKDEIFVSNLEGFLAGRPCNSVTGK